MICFNFYEHKTALNSKTQWTPNFYWDLWRPLEMQSWFVVIDYDLL